MNSNTKKMVRIVVVAVNDIEDMELTIPVDIWKRAKFVVDVISGESRNSISLHHSTLKISTHKKLTELNFSPYDALFLPGGAGYEGYLKPPACKNDKGESKLDIEIKKFYKQKKWLIGICASPIIFLTILKTMENSKIEQTKFTAYPCPKILRNFQNNWVDERVVIDKNLITAQSAGCAFDLAFQVIELLDCSETALRVAKEIGYPWDEIKKMKFNLPTVKISD